MRHMFLPDLQVPFHHEPFVRSLLLTVEDIQPDRLWFVGDVVDSPDVSRWNKGQAGEYADTLYQTITSTTDLFNRIRRVYDGPVGWKVGNHDERYETYVQRYAPALTSFPAIKIEGMFETEQYGIDVHRSLVDVAAGWVLAHGHEGAYRQAAGQTALQLALKVGKSVVCGHTHKVALVPGGPAGYNNQQAPTIWGMEVGHAMDVTQVTYVKSGGYMWQKGFGLLDVREDDVYPSVITATHDGRYCFEGVSYG